VHGGPVVRACVADDAGHFFDTTAGALPVLPYGRTYSLVAQFAQGSVPAAANVTAPDATHAFAAPDNLTDANDGPRASCPDQGLPESNLSNGVGSHATLDHDVVTSLLDAPPPKGVQVVLQLDLCVLLPSDGGTCLVVDSADGAPSGAGHAAFELRFYVDHAPAACP
jgi:hypothetical protein